MAEGSRAGQSNPGGIHDEQSLAVHPTGDVTVDCIRVFRKCRNRLCRTSRPARLRSPYPRPCVVPAIILKRHCRGRCRRHFAQRASRVSIAIWSLVGQSRGDGANWQTAEYRDAIGNANSQGKANGHKEGVVCAYHGTAFTTAGRTHVGVPSSTSPTMPARRRPRYLTTTSMLDPWESLKVNERRQLLAADNGHNGGGGPEVDIYDLSTDCRNPQLLASLPVGTGTDGSGIVHPIVGHEGSWAPDGLTYYGGDLSTERRPVLRGRHRRSDASEADHDVGARASPTCTACRSATTAIAATSSRWATSASRPDLTDPTVPANNGLLIYDLSQIQARVPNPQVRSDQHAVLEGRLRRAAHDTGQDQGQAVSRSSSTRRARAASAAPRSKRPHAPPACRRSRWRGSSTSATKRIRRSCRDSRSRFTIRPIAAQRPAGSRRAFDLHLRQPLLQRRQQGEGDDAGLRLLQLGDPGVRHPRSGAAEGNRVFQSGRHDDAEPWLQSRSHRPVACRRPRLVHGAGSSRCRQRDALDDVPGQRAAYAQVHERRVAVPAEQDARGRTELAGKSSTRALTASQSLHGPSDASLGPSSLVNPRCASTWRHDRVFVRCYRGPHNRRRGCAGGAYLRPRPERSGSPAAAAPPQSISSRETSRYRTSSNDCRKRSIFSSSTTPAAMRSSAWT